jgi:light-regulated signal transduction histidine kinase (bacteriophytochrome)
MEQVAEQDPRTRALLDRIESLARGELSATRNLALDDGFDPLRAALSTLTARMADHSRDMQQIQGENERMRAKVLELERANAALRDFAYLASHDLQEPLRMVTSYTQLLELQFGDKLGDRGKSYIYFAADGARRTQKLIQDLLAYSKLDEQSSPRARLDVNELLRDVLRDLAMAVTDSHAQIAFSGLPEVTADRDQLRSLFRNLIGNAIKYRSEATPRITISGEQSGNCTQFNVHDNGIGIAPKHHQRIFKIFQRLHTREEYSGTGIGLAMCKRIVENHGGKLWVESQESAGSTFMFTIMEPTSL